eukprot:jgi/Botrbrau1/13142/Bobra.0187s0092.1
MAVSVHVANPGLLFQLAGPDVVFWVIGCATSRRHNQISATRYHRGPCTGQGCQAMPNTQWIGHGHKRCFKEGRSSFMQTG